MAHMKSKPPLQNLYRGLRILCITLSILLLVLFVVAFIVPDVHNALVGTIFQMPESEGAIQFTAIFATLAGFIVAWFYSFIGGSISLAGAVVYTVSRGEAKPFMVILFFLAVAFMLVGFLRRRVLLVTEPDEEVEEEFIKD